MLENLATARDALRAQYEAFLEQVRSSHHLPCTDPLSEGTTLLCRMPRGEDGWLVMESPGAKVIVIWVYPDSRRKMVLSPGNTGRKRGYS